MNTYMYSSNFVQTKQYFMAQTAMQQLVEHIQINATKFSLMNTYNILKEIEPYLEKEKEQIINDYINGKANGYDAINKGAEYNIIGEEYHNQTYNQNK